MQHLPASLERATEEDEPLVDERVHEARVLAPAFLLAKIP